MIVFDSVTKTFDNGHTAVRNLSLEVEDGESVVLLGTSGCGKTTTLKMVNRLIEPTSGRIEVHGSNIMEQDRIALRRQIGFAIQHIGLFPHMTVAENVGVVPRLLKWKDDKIRERTDKMLNMMGLDADEYRDRFPNQLSGGQRQRVGVARALAADPPIVLMDEPFGALDPITREQLQNEFLDLESEIKKTILFVTHDLFEAVKIADRIALIDGGEIQQLASPAELIENPANEFVDQFLGRHRFQLALLTRTIRHVMTPLAENERRPASRGAPRIRPRDSYIEALDTFKTERIDTLDVVERGVVVGRLEESDLLDSISEVFGKATARDQ